MALTEVPIELSSTPGIVDNSTATAITIDASQNVTLSANLTVNGDLITFGDANTDSIDFNAEISSNLIPSGARDLGSVGKEWTNLYISGTGDIATLTSTSSTIGTLTVSTTATIPYDNTISGLNAVNVQSAISELNTLIGGGNVGSQASFDVFEFTATASQSTFDVTTFLTGGNVTATQIVTNVEYEITVVGDTDFTTIGAASNNVGIRFTATGSTTGTGIVRKVATYIPGYIQVFLNGLLLSETDYTATDGENVVLVQGADLNDILAVKKVDSFNTAEILRVLSVDSSASTDALVVDANDNLVVGGEIHGPATLVIDPAVIGDNTGLVLIQGNLQVDGTQTTINSTTVEVDDLNITVASGAVDSAAANTAGLDIDGAGVQFRWNHANTHMNLNTNLDVTGTVTADGLTVEKAGVSQIVADFSGTGANAYIQLNDGNSTNFAGLGVTTDSLSLWSLNKKRIDISSGGDISFYEDTGTSPKMVWKAADERLGIGTDNPGNILKIFNTADSEGLDVENTNASFSSSGLFVNNTSSTGGNLLRLRSFGSDKVVVLGTGNVGIGTSPSTTLHLLAASTNIRLEDSDTNAYGQVGVDNTGSLYLQADNGNGQASSNMYMYVDGTERMRISSSGDVGIGTTSPNATFKLDVEGAVRTNGTGLYVSENYSSGNNVYKIYDNSNEFRIESQIFANANTASSPIVFATSNTDGRLARMTIESSGNVGIGTGANIDEALHVEKATGTTLVKTEVASGSVVGYEITKTGATSQSWRIVDGQTANGKLEIYDVTDSRSVMTFDGDGKVGIGTAYPDEALHVNSGNTNDVALFESTDVNARIIIKDNTTTNTINANAGKMVFICDSTNAVADSYMGFEVDNIEAMRIDASGNVGIGCTPENWDPAFDVLRVGKTANLFSYDTAGDGLWLGSNAFYDDTLNDYKYITTDPVTLYTQINGTHVWSYAASGTADTQVTFSEAMRIDSSGNVGIDVVPSTWASAWTALDIGDGTLFSQNNRTTGLGSNLYFTGSDWFPKETGESALYQISQGTHNWYINSSVTSGVSFTPTPKMTLDASGNLLVGTTSSDARLTVHRDTHSTGSDVANISTDQFDAGVTFETGEFILFGDWDGTADKMLVVKRAGVDVFDLNSVGEITSAPTYNNTTASAANVYIAANAKLYRSTSSARYKNTIEDASFGLSETLSLRPVTYKGNNDGDVVYGGLIAEEVHDAGLTQFVQYDEEGRPDSLAYGNMVSLCIKAIQEQQDLIESLTARIATLEGSN